MEWFKEWSDCVFLCHEDQSSFARQRMVSQLRLLPNRIDGTSAILAARLLEVAAYLVIHPGRLGSIGGIFLPKPDRIEDIERVGSLLCRLIEHASAEIEIVQAITFANEPKNEQLHQCYLAAGLKKTADLHQMECTVTVQVEIPSEQIAFPNGKGTIRFVPWEPAMDLRFTELVDRTYIETLDVPELNGLRDSHSTLVGYAASLPTTERPWWFLRDDTGSDIGCLMLCPYSDFTELVYVGLVPESRGHGYSKSVMRFAHRWTRDRGLHRIVLAVDVRNTPAIKLYHSLGYEMVGSVSAWIRSV